MNQPTEVICDNLDDAILRYTGERGYRLDMVTPADAPAIALLSLGDEIIKLTVNETRESKCTTDWVTGRAGMMYRDLLPDRLGGKLIASHIRIREGGPVADSVHYHKVKFQMIYCLKGAIRVVYEDQGEPFTLLPGDCVLQPPEIRHRVLEAEVGSEVVELAMPATHETWFDHELQLPTASVQPDRDFGGQRFVRHIADQAERHLASDTGFEWRDTGIAKATGGLADVRISRATDDQILPEYNDRGLLFYFVISGSAKMGYKEYDAVNAFVKQDQTDAVRCPPGTELLLAAF